MGEWRKGGRKEGGMEEESKQGLAEGRMEGGRWKEKKGGERGRKE